jgi:hypothetical protein
MTEVAEGYEGSENNGARKKAFRVNFGCFHVSGKL